jgi:hypothetical protein
MAWHSLAILGRRFSNLCFEINPLCLEIKLN